MGYPGRLLYAAAFILSCAGGGAVLWILQLLLGSRILDSEAGLISGFCHGRMKLLGLVKNPTIISRTLATVGEATEGRGSPPAIIRVDWPTALVSLTLPVRGSSTICGRMS